jgi:hypothetical protein
MTKRAEPGFRVKSLLTHLENTVVQAVWASAPCIVETEYQGNALRVSARWVSVTTSQVTVRCGKPDGS